tara:strand:+ start:424 stop:717 length:294 start_codon:yes stop_codon:yes gene_type:complete
MKTKTYQEFANYFLKNSALSEKSIRNYIGGLNKITRDIIEYDYIKMSLDEIEVDQIQSLKNDYFELPKHKAEDIKAKNMYNAAFNNYIKYRRDTYDK